MSGNLMSGKMSYVATRSSGMVQLLADKCGYND